MSYRFTAGHRLVVPYLDKFKQRVKASWVGLELIKVLQERLPFLNNNDLAEAFEGQRVLVSGCLATPTQRLKLTDMVEIIFHRHEPEVLSEPVKLLYMDSDVVVVDKPSSIPVHPVGKFKKNTVIEILREERAELCYESRPLKVVHRLDRCVSGVLILARSTVVARKLSELMKSNKICKEYIAKVKGCFPGGVLEVCQPVSVQQQQPLLMAVDQAKGKRARTVFEFQKSLFGGEESLVLCRPVTGRTHQIRVHLQWLGYPVVDDWRYGGIDTNSMSDLVSLPQPIDVSYQPWCAECIHGRHITLDPGPCQICLHALRYSSCDESWQWSFETPLPAWAR